jgi:hypothetical protein
MRWWIITLITFVFCNDLMARKTARTIDIDSGSLNGKWTDTYESDEMNVKVLLQTLQPIPTKRHSRSIYL